MIQNNKYALFLCLVIESANNKELFCRDEIPTLPYYLAPPKSFRPRANLHHHPTYTTYEAFMSLDPISHHPLPSQDITVQDPTTNTSPLSSPSAIHISPSSLATESTTSEDEEDDIAEREWQESLAQLTLLFNLVLLPFAGKYFGRRFAYFSMSHLPMLTPLAFYRFPFLCWMSLMGLFSLG